MRWSGSNQPAALQALEPAAAEIADAGMTGSVNIRNEIASGGLGLCLRSQAHSLQQYNPRINRGQLTALPNVIGKRIHCTAADGIDTATGWTTSVELVDANHTSFVRTQRRVVSTSALNADCNGFQERIAEQREHAQKILPTTRVQL